MSFEQFCGITQSVTIIVLRAGELCSRVVHHFSCLKLQSFSGAYRFSRSPPQRSVNSDPSFTLWQET